MVFLSGRVAEKGESV